MLHEHEIICPSLIGRDGQLAVASRMLARAREGTGQVVLVAGEAGVGKSRLLRAVAEEARAGGFFVLQGASFESERSMPYAPLLDLVRLFAASASPAFVEHVFSPAAAEMVAMFPELQPLLPNAIPAAAIDPESDRRRLFHALAQAATLLARTQPVLLAFEDVHWSDDATLDLVFHLARSQAGHAVAIIFTYRDEEVGNRLSKLIADLERTRLAMVISLDRLGRDGIAAMVNAIFGRGDALSGDFVGQLYRLTDGNPFFLEETLKALVIAGDLVPGADGRWRARPLERVRVPRTAVEAVRRRLAALTVPARAVASIAAVAGRRFDFALLQALTSHAEDELLAHVKELIAAQLVVEESADRFAFRHALTREAIYAELLTRERIALHRQVASSLEESHGDARESVVEALEYHAWAAGDWTRAAAYADRAARHALALSAPREAVAYLDRGVAASARAGIDISIEVHLLRGRAHETLGEFQRADEDFTTALQRARAGKDGSDRRAEWDALHALGKLWAARDYSRAGEYRREALRVARALGDGALIARSLNRIGNWHINHDEARAGLVHHEEALAIFQSVSDDAGVAETVDLVAMAHHVDGMQHPAAVQYERSIALFTDAGDRRGVANSLGVLAVCGPSYHSSSTTPAFTTIIEDELKAPRAFRLANEIGWRAGEAFVSFLIADCLAWRGDYRRALPLARQALAHAVEIDHLEWTAGARRLLGTMSLDLLAPGGRDHLEAAHGIARQLRSRLWSRWTAAPLAVARSREGDLAGAEALLTEFAPETSADSASLTLAERHLWLAQAEFALAAEKPARALEIVEARLASERAADPESPLGVPRLSLLRAQALMALDRIDDAQQALRAARAEATAQRASPMLWRIDAASGHAHRKQRQRLEARRAFESARATGLELAASIPDDELRAQFQNGLESIAPSPAPPSEARIAKGIFGGLTRRERDVAELVAQGKPNKRIAHDLGIGERTVEGHVARALSKLGFASRSQLAAWAVEKGIHRS